MLEKVLKTIRKYNMVSPGDRILVGVSGGADSLALLHMLRELRETLSISLFVAHVNHGIRGEDAHGDARFVASVAEDWGIPFYLKEAKVPELAGKWKVSEEEAGRRIRYEFFDEVLDMIKGTKIALAHHQDDQVETILHHIIRGTGLKGLQGMKPVRDRRIIRPLLELSRREIEDYCTAHGLKFREDVTNLHTIYTRNRIRHLLVPCIRDNFNPAFADSLTRMAGIIREEEEFLSEYCRRVFARWAIVDSQELKIPLDFFKSCHTAVIRRVLKMGMERILGGPDRLQYKHIDGIMDMVLNARTGAVIELAQGARAILEYDAVILSSSSAEEEVGDFCYYMDIPGQVEIQELGIVISVRETNKTHVWSRRAQYVNIDGDAIQGRLMLRNRRAGDRFKPLGMKGTKKLKDFFIDNKIPRQKRRSIPLVVDSKNIIWVVGYQIHDAYKVTPETKRILKICAKSLKGGSSNGKHGKSTDQ